PTPPPTHNHNPTQTPHPDHPTNKQNRNEVVRRGNRVMEVGVVPQADDSRWRGGQMLSGCVVKAVGPVESPVRLVPVDTPQIVDDVSASDDEDAEFAQWRELRAQLEVVLQRSVGVDG